MTDDIIKRLREAIAEHPLSPIQGYAADIAGLLDRLDEAREAARTWENEAERRSRRYEECAVKLDKAERENERLIADLKEAVGLRVTLYRHSDCDGDTDRLTDRQVAERDEFARRWLATIDAARAAERGKE